MKTVATTNKMEEKMENGKGKILISKQRYFSSSA